jgi:hypothetical protein
VPRDAPIRQRESQGGADQQLESGKGEDGFHGGVVFYFVQRVKEWIECIQEQNG